MVYFSAPGNVPSVVNTTSYSTGYSCRSIRGSGNPLTDRLSSGSNNEMEERHKVEVAGLKKKLEVASAQIKVRMCVLQRSR